jgi:hypothetical protein
VPHQLVPASSTAQMPPSLLLAALTLSIALPGMVLQHGACPQPDSLHRGKHTFPPSAVLLHQAMLHTLVWS